jgi:hypothetical protein
MTWQSDTCRLHCTVVDWSACKTTVWLLLWSSPLQIRATFFGSFLHSAILLFSRHWNWNGILKRDTTASFNILFFFMARLPSCLLIFGDPRSHSLRHTTLGRTPLDEWSPCHKDLYLTKHNTHNRQTSMPPGGIGTHNPVKRADADPRFRPHGYADRRPSINLLNLLFVNTLYYSHYCPWNLQLIKHVG